MLFARFGFNGVLGPCGLEAQVPDPKKPDPRARVEMEAFDLLPSETRALVRDSSNDVGLGSKLISIRQRGAPRRVLEKLQARGLLPYQVGEGGILAEIVADELQLQPEKKTA